MKGNGWMKTWVLALLALVLLAVPAGAADAANEGETLRGAVPGEARAYLDGIDADTADGLAGSFAQLWKTPRRTAAARSRARSARWCAWRPSSC